MRPYIVFITITTIIVFLVEDMCGKFPDSCPGDNNMCVNDPKLSSRYRCQCKDGWAGTGCNGVNYYLFVLSTIVSVGMSHARHFLLIFLLVT